MEQQKAVKPLAASVDLAGLDSVKAANGGITHHLYSPKDGSDLGIRIHCVGRDSDAFKRKNAENQRKRVARLSKGGFRPGNAPIDDGEKDGLGLLAACSTGWDHRTELGDEEAGTEDKWAPGIILAGELVEFSEEAAQRIYAKYPWIKEQMDEVIGDRALFMKG